MKFISWNINGLKNILSKNVDGAKITSEEHQTNALATLIKQNNPDFVCLQEVRCNNDVILSSFAQAMEFPYVFQNCATSKKGYSGTAILTKHDSLSVTYGYGNFNTDPAFNDEGRMITLEYDKFYLVTVYTPNSKQQLERLDYRTKEWDELFKRYIAHLEQSKNVIVCGDMNVAHEEIDIHSPSTNTRHAGFTKDERTSFSNILITNSLTDTFRYVHKDVIKYSWWSNFHQSRAKNKGWRIDYFLTSSKLNKKIKDADIFTTIKGSDHAPVYLELDIKIK